MLKEFRVDNFKSLINGIFRPQGMNLLLGLNNSGKTSLCQALQFVSGSALAPLDRCADAVARGRFGMTNFALDKSTVDFHVRAHVPHLDEELMFEYELTISPPQNGFMEAAVGLTRELLSVTGGAFAKKTILLENRAGRIRILDEPEFMRARRSEPGHGGGLEPYRETSAPTDATMLQRIYDEESNPRAVQFKRYLAGWSYYDLSSASMRGAVYKPGSFVLDSDGENLASVLFMLKSGRERDYRRLLEVIRKIEPRLDLINFMGSEKNVFMFFEDSDGNSVPAVNASSGTLRFLAMAYVLLIQPTDNLSPLYMLEEPENGIHVSFLKTLIEMVDSSPGRPQLVFTSHAPYFIDLFDSHLDGVFVLNRDRAHTSITQPDIEAARARLGDFPLGEQHFREML
jgi:predicted ATPase